MSEVGKKRKQDNIGSNESRDLFMFGSNTERNSAK